MPNLAHTIADGIFRDLQIHRSTVRFVGSVEYRFALDAADRCDVYIRGDYAETLFDYGDLLAFCPELAAKSRFREIIRALADTGHAEMTESGVLYAFDYEFACNSVSACRNGKHVCEFTHRSELLDYITALMEGE